MPHSGPSGPWQPLTFGGVAAFAQPARGRLLRIQFAMALLVAGSLTWLLAHAWLPQIDLAVDGLPARGAIRNGTLEWEGTSPVSLADGPFLSFTVDLDGSGDLGRSADLHVELGRTELRLGSLFGYWRLPYPHARQIVLSRTEVNAWWGAWRAFLLIGAGALAAISLLASWVGLAILYAFGVRLIAFYTDRQVSTLGSVRLAAAAQLPGAAMMGLALLLYGNQRLSLLGLLLAWVIHWVIGWVYAALAPFRLPRRATPTAGGRNPFGPPSSASKRRTPASPFNPGS